jgi:hypothetical protein
MDADVKTDGSDKRLNNLVAVTVVILSVFMAVSKIKDDNVTSLMRDAWYSAQTSTDTCLAFCMA